MSEPIVTRSKRRRRTVALRVLPDGTLTVQAPLRTSLKWIEAFIASRADWIAKRRAEVERARQIKPLDLQSGSAIPFLGRTLQLDLREEDAYAPPEENEATLRLTLPPGLSPQTQQAEIRTELALWYKKKARTLFAERLTFWATRMAVRPTRLILTEPARQWGSCNVKNEIRLNWRLIMGDAEWLDYVIVHELAHIPHKNHGPAFWRCVSAALPDYRARRRALRAWKGEDWLMR